ncbi:MAG: hypothetical protein M3Y56_07690, partial [Armatimonadota bacterium]|nr:hypothetical protein [Armatimonadota bacterium]
DSDTWSLGLVSLTAEARAWIRPTNEIAIRNEGGDAWKFRNLSLAVQLASGEWVRTPIRAEVHSSPNWAFTEGSPWGADGSVDPVEVNFEPGR